MIVSKVMLFSTDNVCSANPYLNKGTCTPNKNSLGFECSCPSGYIGFNCGIKRGDRVSLVYWILSAVLLCMIPDSGQELNRSTSWLRFMDLYYINLIHWSFRMFFCESVIYSPTYLLARSITISFPSPEFRLVGRLGNLSVHQTVSQTISKDSNKSLNQ